MITRSSLILLLAHLSLFSAETDTDLFNNLTDDMSSIAQTAKDQRANIDYLPFIMTVFDGEELAHAGASSLKEALSLAAGVNIASDNLSLFNPVFRGSNPVAYGQSKLIVDGVEVNDLFFDGYTAYLSMPIDMIKRIEIVRGPGSYSDGHSGYAGSIVVTTYKEEAPSGGVSRWFASAGTYGTRKAGASYATKHDDFSFAADLYTIHDNLSLSYGPDGMSNGILSYNLGGNLPGVTIDNRPLSQSGHAPSATDATMVSASLSKGAFFADGRISSYRHGSAGGINYALAADGDHYNIDQWQIRSGAHYNINSFTGTVQAAMIQDSFVSHQLLAPAEFRYYSLTLPTPVVVTYPDGFYGIHEAFIRTYRVNNTLAGTLFGGDTTFGISGSWSSVTSEKTITTDRDSGTGMTDYSTTLPFFNPNGSINNLTAYMTYEKVITPVLTGYASLTVDRRNGISPQIDPRIAAVYAIDPANLIKFSISRAHRNPSWQEMFTLNNKARWGNPDLLPETVIAYETQYIHQFETDHTLSFNLFRLNNDNQIYLQYNPSLARYEYVNGLKSSIQGIEGEWRKRYDATTFYAAYTHIWAEDGNGVTLANTPSDTARGFITQNLDEHWYGSLAGRWQNKIPRAATDTRNDMKAIGIVDTSIGYKLPYLNSEIQFTVKNIFDEKEFYPSPSNTYDGDYPSTGRAFMATLRGTF
ncbi:MAG: TonB-dependent receptor plug domain-containing protein [Sulfuricurvum sp.]|uniref:TonB-dependent receptor n=1 Tax=Sulfuricurvum sp. TaxID=2025608 RepID=UPI00261712A6|nr:TonB-dependent receptor plug domain-containing protein [Sulfuricurvum sp.]MDD2368551.1 TonB-dependent receptor plug domain-containing protein [Sulfuricurvum sp.]MDD5118644.1 TonB-dependent receptor plug domain-containing protein [Sulfuricurvum sp.]